MFFQDLSDEAKLLFVILAAEWGAGHHQVVSAFYKAGAPPGSYIDAWISITSFIQDCRLASAEELKRRRDHQRKVNARIRA